MIFGSESKCFKKIFFNWCFKNNWTKNEYKHFLKALFIKIEFLDQKSYSYGRNIILRK